jgi:hypothetical protein
MASTESSDTPAGWSNWVKIMASTEGSDSSAGWTRWVQCISSFVGTEVSDTSGDISLNGWLVGPAGEDICSKTLNTELTLCSPFVKP